MAASNIVISLVGGPPWGFRVSQDKNGLPYISQVLPEGRADKEGVKFGDYIDQVNGENCHQVQQIHNKMRSAHGVLRLRLKRFNDALLSKQFLKKSTSENHPPTSLPVSKSNAAAKPPVINSYNGGMRGSAQEKKHYFEAAIAKQIQPIPPPVKKHGKKFFGAPIMSNFGFSSESETDLSSYDSVSAENYSTSGYGNQPSVMSSEGTENSWYESTSTESSIGSKTPTIFDYENYDHRDRMNSATPVAVKCDGKRSPLFYWNENGPLNTNQNMNDTSTDSGVTLSNSDKMIPLLPPPPPTKTWQLKVDDLSPKATPTISTTVVTGSASGEVEIPGPKSVSELRAEIATKLEVRNPAGQIAAPVNSAVPINSAIVHSPLQPQHSKLTPTVSFLSLDQLQVNYPDQRSPGSTFSATLPLGLTASQFYEDYSPKSFNSKDQNYGNKYLQSPFKRDFEVQSLQSPRSSVSDFGQHSPLFSPLRRQHSQIITPPEIQHAVLLHPGYDTAKPSRNRFSISMMELSQPFDTLHDTMGEKKILNPDLTSSMFETSKPEILHRQNSIEHSADFIAKENEKNKMMFRDENNDHICIQQQHGHGNDTPLLSKWSTDDEQNNRELPTPSFPARNELESQVQNLHVNEIDVTAAAASADSKVEKSIESSNRLAELIELARKSFNDDTGHQLVDFLWSKPNNDDGGRFKVRNGSRLQRPHSVYELSSDMENVNGYQTLPIIRRQPKNKDPVNDEKSAWYKEIHKLCHKIPNVDERTVSYRTGETESSMLNNHSITPQSRLEQQQNEQLLFEQQQKRAKSVGRYDPVADMEILEHWSRQKQQFMREQNERPVMAMEALQIACSPYLTKQMQLSVNNPTANRAASAANSYAITRSQTQHFHLPSYRFTHEDSRPILSPRSCFRCGKNRRDYTWSEIETLYQMLDKTGLEKEIRKDKLSDCIKARYIETKLDQTAQDLQKLIDQLENFGKTRSKSNPEIIWKLRNSSGKFSYLTGQKPSTSSTGSQHGSPNPLTKGVNEMKKMTMEEILQRQKAEKLSEELIDQKNRKHGYFPGASPLLQNNVQRFDHLLHGNISTNVDSSGSRCSTPVRRSFTSNPIRTCTALYKFVAQSSKELSLNRGDVVRVNREVDSNWIEGERNGHVGIFPASYVQIDEDASTSKNRVRALYSFQARNKNELSLKKGEILRKRREIDSNWFEGTNSKGQIGIFPKCYVQIFIDGQEEENSNESNVIPDRPKTPKIVTTNDSRAMSPPSSKKEVERSHQIQQWEQRHGNFGFSGPAKIVPKNSETYRALYPYTPQHPDELELQENDIVFVVQKCDDGWMIGTLLRTGQFGTFPGNYVEKH